MDPKLAQAMNDANAVLVEYGLVVGSPNNWSGIWHLYYFDVNTKNCFPVFDPSWQDRELTTLSDLLKGFPEGTKAEVILEWAERNGILED